MIFVAKLASNPYCEKSGATLNPRAILLRMKLIQEFSTSLELAVAIQKMFVHSRVAAIGVASLPFGQRDKQRISLQAAYA